MTGWRLGRDGILRPLIARSALAFWASHDVDLWINQRLLVRRVVASRPGTDKDTVRSVLDGLVDQGFLIRRTPTPTRTIYRLACRFADPTAPGYAREVDELLVDPLPWVSCQGQFFRFGPLGRGGAWVLPVASFPHHFTKHAWMRAWIRAFDQGLFQDPPQALQRAAQAARDAPLHLLWSLWRDQGNGGTLSQAGHAFEATRLWRETRRTHAAPSDEPSPPSPHGAGWSEAAIRILHELCGHEHLGPLLGPPLLRAPRRVLEESFVYEALDRHASTALGVAPEPGAPKTENVSTDVSRPVLEIPLDRLMVKHAEAVRALEPGLRATLWDHRIAWPHGFFSPRVPPRPAAEPPKREEPDGEGED